MGTAKRERQKANRQLRLEQIAQEQRRGKQKKLILRVAIIVPLVIAALYLLVFVVGGNDDDEPTTEPVATEPVTSDPATDDPATDDTATDDTAAPVAFTYGTGECAPAEKPAEPVRSFAAAPAQCIDASKNYTAVVETNKGSFTIELATDTSPGTVNNFVTLARYGYYDGTGCHRIIDGFVVQCGRPGDDEEAPGYTIADELPGEGEYAEAVVAMANTGSPNTGGGQWFVITGEQGAALPPQYSILGTVTEGYDTTVAALAALADPAAENGVPPLEQVDITSVEITES